MDARAPLVTIEQDPRWAAVVARDRAADGRFVYSVRTTGVYCRPSCPARLANPQNVSFHETCAEAKSAGFRACKRCRPVDDLATRIAAFDWDQISASLDANGNAVIARLLTGPECADAVGLYADDARFRSTITMARHGFGRGEYRYFAYPLPDPVAALRGLLYPRLVPIANRWHDAMKIATRFPDAHADFISRCHAAGQTRPTPLLLRYGAGDYNCLHQDLYGEHVFPLQIAILLSEPGSDFDGGEFVLTEQRPRMQSRAEVLPLRRGDAAIFAVRHRPVRATRGTYRVTMRHGVSRVRTGTRHTLGIIFHDAR